MSLMAGRRWCWLGKEGCACWSSCCLLLGPKLLMLPPAAEFGVSVGWQPHPHFPAFRDHAIRQSEMGQVLLGILLFGAAARPALAGREQLLFRLIDATCIVP